MGTPSHHQSKAAEFLTRADRAITDLDQTEAAAALRRAASHAATALAVHYACRHNSTRRLETTLHVAIAHEHLGRNHLKTFRQTRTLPQRMTPAHHRTRAGMTHAPRRQPSAHPEPVAGRHSPQRCRTTLRRMRRRVSALIKATAAVLAGQPKPVRHHKLWQRKPDLPVPPDFSHVRDILTLPNFPDIRARFGLHSVSLGARPDPHGCYARGDEPRRCPCHAQLWDRPQDPTRITLSPLWHRALEKTFRIKLPQPLQLPC